MAATMVEKMVADNEIVVHAAPVWRERSNFIIRAPLREADRPKRFEQLFARQVGEDRFEICCIPFFLFDVALGDVVATSLERGSKYLLDRVVAHSGRFVFRAWFGESDHPSDQIEEQLGELGALFERASAHLLAIDAADSSHAQAIADYLAEQEEAGRLMYETGRS